MALSASFNGTNVTVADSVTDWDNDTITAPEAWTVEVLHQGSGCIGFQASSKDGSGLYTYASTFNFSTTHAGQHVFFWVNVTMPGTVEALSTGGLYLCVGSSSTAYKKFLIAAKDYKEVMEKGFARFVLDPTKTSTEDVGSPDMTAVNTFGVWIDTDESARIDQLFIDRIDVGWGIEVTGTSTDFWNDLVVEDIGLNAGVRDNMFGIVQKYNDVFFLYGQVKIGDDTGTLSTAVSDSGKTVKFVSQQYYDGTSAWVDMVADDFFKIELVDNSTGSTQFTDGILVGTEGGRAGSTISGSVLHDTEIDFDTGLVNASSFVKLYSTKLLDMRAGITYHDDVDSLFYAGTVSRSGQFHANQAEIRGVVFSETSDVDAALNWTSSIDIEGCSFIANITGAGIEHSGQGSFTYTSLLFSGNSYDLLYSDSASSGVLTINSIGSNVSTSEITNATGNSVSILTTVTINIYVKDSVNNAVSGAAVAIYKTSDDTQIMNELSVVTTGLATEDFNYVTDTPVYIRVRKSSSGTRYFPVSTTGTIDSNGLTLTVVLNEDAIAT